MDPNTCLALLLDAAVAGDGARLREYAAYLAAWLDRGGFPPTDPRRAGARRRPARPRQGR
jgi:hypothetical protein